MILRYLTDPIYLGEFNYKLGALRWDLDTLKAQDLIAGGVEALRALGYEYCLGLGDDETLLSLARDPLSRTLNEVQPNAIVAQHCLSESAVLP